MKELLDFLKKNKTEYDIGIINNNHFHKLLKPFKDKQVVRFKWKKESISKLIYKLKNININISMYSENKYCALYNIEDSPNQIFIIYAVNSHVQLPKLMLKNFKTNNDLFFLDTTDNTIHKSSAKNYNTEFGYYSLYFEEYLNKNYEQMIVELIQIILPFINKDIQSITIENLYDKVNKLFLMSLFRNPKVIDEINETSIFSKIIDGGYDAELIAYAGEDMKTDYIKGNTPLLVVNRSKIGFVTIKSLISNLFVDNGVNAMFIPLHPKFGIALMPNNYYKQIAKTYGNDSFLLLDKDKDVHIYNKHIYRTAKFHDENVIGFKDELEILKNIEWEK